MSYTLQQEHQILRLIKQRRKNNYKMIVKRLEKPMSYQIDKLN